MALASVYVAVPRHQIAAQAPIGCGWSTPSRHILELRVSMVDYRLQYSEVRPQAEWSMIDTHGNVIMLISGCVERMNDE